MDKFKEQDSFLYYKNELVATFIPVISFVEVLHNRVTDSYTYKYHVSIKTVDCEMGQKRVFDSLQNISFHKKKNGKRFYEIDYKRLKYFCQLQDAK